MIITDTHTHLYSEAFNEDRQEMIERAIKSNVKRFFIPAIDSNYTESMYKLEAEYPNEVFLMMGLHPTSVKENYKEELKHVEEQFQKRSFYAVGEIGIDLYWDKSTLPIQIEAFKHQISLAKQYKLPIVIHCREAFDEIFEVLEEEKSDDLFGIFHCFTGNIEQAKQAISYNMRLGIGGVVTFKNGKIDQFLNEIDLKHIVLETDSPYLAPKPYRGKRNESSYINKVLEKLSEIYILSVEEIAEITTDNSKSRIRDLIMSKPNILLIYTGGTIGMVKDANTGALKAFDFNNLLKRIPELRLLDCNIDTISFDEPIDSSNINPKYWCEIADIIKKHYKEFDGFVVLHGSDTMSYSASALSFILENLAKPVIFTGSQLPIGDLRTDAKENLITSIQLATLNTNGEPIIREVGLYFEYKLYRGNRTTKINAEHFEAFESLNYPHLAESGVNLKVNKEYLLKPNTEQTLKVNKNMDTHVAILKLFPGISKPVLEAVLTSKLIKGLILETYGSGNATTEPWFIDLLKQAVKRGMYIVNVTQCAGGSVNMGQYETSSQLKQIGLISGKDLTTEAAITKLMYLIGQNINPLEFQIIFETSLRGEMS